MLFGLIWGNFARLRLFFSFSVKCIDSEFLLFWRMQLQYIYLALYVVLKNWFVVGGGNSGTYFYYDLCFLVMTSTH
jgi:hypothetical protein